MTEDNYEPDPASQAGEFRKNTSKLAAKLDKQGRKEKERRDDIANHAVRSPESVLSSKLKAASTQGGKKPITLPTIGRK